MTDATIEGCIYDLYDEYCHGEISRRQFFERAAAATAAGAAMASSLLPNYADAQEVLFTDERIKATWVNYPSSGGVSGEMRGYLVQPVGDGPFGAVLVIHENRGLNPYIQDVARRAAVSGFLALAPDGLYPVGGYPGNDDDGRALQRSLDQEKMAVDMINSASYVRTHALSNGKLGATGFCWGGGMTNRLAAELGSELAAGAPYYGGAADPDGVSNIKASLLIHYAEDDPRVNSMRTGYEALLRKHGVSYEMHTYPGTRHGFHNYSTPRYDEAAAKLSWQRTMDFFGRHLD